MEEESQPEQDKPEQFEQKVPKKSKRKKKTLVTLLIILLIAAAAGAGWWWRDRDAKKLDQYRQGQISDLNSQAKKLKGQLADAKKSAKSSPLSTSCPAPGSSELENIKAAVNSGNTAALEGYMKPSVNVILAASEAYGPQTPTQAINDLTNELKTATSPWDFDLSAAILSSYGQGDYAQYFPNDALVGKSVNKHVVSFQFDCNKISGIFIGIESVL